MAQASIPYRIEWRPKARDDLRIAIGDIDEGSGKLAHPERAGAFVQELRSQIGQLAQRPEVGRAGRPGLPGQVRELMVSSDYIVFYRVLPQAGVVEILRMKPAGWQPAGRHGM